MAHDGNIETLYLLTFVIAHKKTLCFITKTANENLIHK